MIVLSISYLQTNKCTSLQGGMGYVDTKQKMDKIMKAVQDALK